MRYHSDRLTQTWIDYRMEIFMRYTMQSMKKQTNQEFLHVLKYDADSADKIEIALSQYEKLPANIRFVRFPDEYKKVLREYVTGSQELYLVRIDSDNMYHYRYIDLLHSLTPDKQTEALVNQHGFILDAVNGRLAHFYARSPSFYTLIYDTEAFLQGHRYIFKTHNDVIRLRHELLSSANFMVLVHERNVSNMFDMRYRGELIENRRDIETTLKDFIGVDGWEAIKKCHNNVY